MTLTWNRKKTKGIAVPKPAAPKAPAKPAPAPQPPVAKKAEEVRKESPALEAPVVDEPEDEPEEAAPAAGAKPQESAESAADRATEERHRRFLLGKKVIRQVATDSGLVIAEVGATVTEEILQKAKLSNKIVPLSMSVQ